MGLITKSNWNMRGDDMGRRSYKLNQFNTLPRIGLVDINNETIQQVNQIQAFQLLRTGLCELLLVKPPCIQFKCTKGQWSDVYLERKERPRRHVYEARKSVLYGNIHIQGPDGHEMFHCNSQRALWYLNRDLADVIDVNPPTLRLKFQPGGVGHVGDKYYLTEKRNCCVVCGSAKDLSRHHVMPRVFRSYFPEEIKDHNYHDVLLLCLQCHIRYEKDASDHKQEICDELGISMNHCWQTYLPDLGEAVKAAKSYCHDVAVCKIKVRERETARVKFEKFLSDLAGKKRIDAIKLARDFFGAGLEKAKNYVDNGVLPEGFTLGEDPPEFDPVALRERWVQVVKDYLKKEEITEEEIREVAGLTPWVPLEGHRNYGKTVLDKIGDLQAFTERWRNHFIRVMEPKFLPDHWEITKKLVRDRSRNKGN